MFSNVVQELTLVMCKMHKSESTAPVRTSRSNVNASDPNATSLYMTEFVAKIRWVFRELISKLYLEVSCNVPHHFNLLFYSLPELTGQSLLLIELFTCTYCTLPLHLLPWITVLE